MPVRKCSNGKWRIGDGPCVYTSKAKAGRAYKAYLAKQGRGASAAEVDDDVLEAMIVEATTCTPGFAEPER